MEGQSFGTATTSRPRFNIFTLEQDLADAHYRLAGAAIEHLAWDQVIEKYDRPHTLFYCDPPYWQTEGYGVDFPWENYEKMAKLSRTIKGTMVISHLDHPDIRQVFSHLSVKEVDYSYTVAGKGQPTACKELIFGNWEGGLPEPRERQTGLF